MKHYKLIGLTSSIILIINYIIIGPAAIFSIAQNWFDTLIQINKTFLFPLAFIGFYYAIYRLFQKFEIKKLIIPVLIILVLAFIRLILNLIHFSGINTPDVLNGLPGIALMLVFIIWAIQVIRNKDDRLKRIRYFVISMLCAHALIFIFTLINMFARTLLYESGYYPFEFINLAYAVYGIGYVFGLLIFVEEFKTKTQEL